MVNNESERTATASEGDLGGRLWLNPAIPPGQLSPPGDDSPLTPPTAGLVTLGYLGAAMRRRLRMWVPIALLGFVVGVGLYVRFPPAYQASSTVLLAYGPNENPQEQIFTDAALATSTAVAARAAHDLRLTESTASFLASYSVAEPTDQVLVFTMNAPTSAQAVQRANGLTRAFLRFRAQYATTQQRQLEASLAGQLTLSIQRFASANGQLSQAQSSGTASAQTLSRLRAQQTLATNALAQTRQSINGTLLTTRAATQSEIEQTQVVNAATPVHHSKTKALMLYVGGGLVGGLAIGLGSVILGALTSGRLRRRDDVAYAFGAPVGLSTGPLRGRSRTRAHDLDRIVAHLRAQIPSAGANARAGLAVVAVDDPAGTAAAVVTLGREIAGHGAGVLLADLSRGRCIARALGTSGAGLHQVRGEGVELVLAVPADGDVTPEGPLRARQPGELAEVAAACDLMLSLVTLDPASGGDHLASWAVSAVAVVTAGKSSADKIRSAGEMIRLAGVRLASVVLVGADHGDESLGAWSTPA